MFLAEMNNERIAYVKLRHLPITYKTGSGSAGLTTYTSGILFDNIIEKLYPQITVGGAEVGASQIFTRMLYNACGEYYVRINTRRLITQTANDLQTGESATTTRQFRNSELDSQRNYFKTNVQLSGITKLGKRVSNSAGVEEGFLRGGGDVEDDDWITLYADSVAMFNEIMNIINARLDGIKEAVTAYGAIPTVNETDDDTVTTTTKTDNQHADTFDPIGTLSASDRSKTTDTYNSTVTVTSKRSNGVSAKTQADIIKDLPNIYAQCISDIKSLLIDPRTIQDMCDWGLVDGWIDWGE